MVPPLPGGHRYGEPQPSWIEISSDGCGERFFTARDAMLFAGMALVTITLVLASAGLGILLGQASLMGGLR
ncbi:MAG: hypothetical protein R3184_03620 [Aurantimonas coralicida]|nr:hypothetical protein [Aurantimonas coralicida]